MESIKNESVRTTIADTFFLYLASMALAAGTLWGIFVTLASGAGWGAIGLMIWFFIVLGPGIVVLGIIYLVIFKAILRRYPLPRSWKYVLYPCIAIVAAYTFWFFYTLIPHS